MKNVKLLVMTFLLSPISACLAVAQTPAETVLREIPGEFEMVGTRDSNAKTLVELTELGITSTRYELRGMVEYENIDGTGMIEMWSHFPGGESYFSKTLETAGPARMLTGNSPPRPFILPFTSKPGSFPIGLSIRVWVPENGRVKVSGLKLVQLNRPAELAAWWTGSASGWIGGILGAAIGTIGAMIGILTTWQRTRPAAHILAVLAVGVSAMLLIGGITALAMGQPYHVWYPLILCGVIGTAVLGAAIWTIRRQSAEYELRRMSAMDAPV